MNRPRILATVPVYNAVQPQPFISFLIMSQKSGIAEAEGRYAIRWMVPGPKIKTVKGRNMASQTALAGNADMLLLIDDDMVCPADMIERLLVHDVDIVSPLFFKTNEVIEPLVFDHDELGNYVPIYEYPQNALFEAPGGTGTGVMLIKIEVLKAMDIPIWRGSIDPSYGEDVDFCKRARALGFRTWCDSSIKVGQMSVPVAIGENAYRASMLTRSV